MLMEQLPGKQADGMCDLDYLFVVTHTMRLMVSLSLSLSFSTDCTGVHVV